VLLLSIIVIQPTLADRELLPYVDAFSFGDIENTLKLSQKYGVKFCVC